MLIKNKHNLEKKKKGKIGENIALFFIYSNGGVLKDLNWTCRWGEIDLIFFDKKGLNNSLVFCEVKYRESSEFGYPNEAITYKKIKAQKRAIQYYLSFKDLNNINWRFDVISVLNKGDRMTIDHYKSVLDFN